MNKDILNTGVQNFISKHSNTDIVSLLLKKPIFDSVSQKELAEQIEARNKCVKKLPTWHDTPKIYYPNKLNIEQTSSEATAQYKATLISGKSLIDITGGFGVDSHFFSGKMETVIHCEIDANLSEIATHNFKVLGIENVKTIHGDGIQFLKNSLGRFDWLFIDPSRRNQLKGKVFRLTDCTPNITDWFDLFFKKADNIMIKTSPVLDITAGLNEIPNVKELHIVAVNNEVKELLWVLERCYTQATHVKTINLGRVAIQRFDFSFDQEKKASSSFHSPMKYLYEPNVAIMKSGAFKTIANRYEVKKLHQHTHLYTSHKRIDFPGRSFLVKQCRSYDSATRSFLKNLKANVATKNFPETVEKIKKRHRIKDGGTTYLFFATNLHNELVVLNCEKLDELPTQEIEPRRTEAP